MKHVGLNVAADPLFSAGYMGTNAGCIIVTADDPSMHSSQNEQDNRYYARAAKVAMVEPADSQECKDFVVAACEISEKFDTPVLFRTTTRISHSKTLVEFGERREQAVVPYTRDMRKYICAPANAYHNHPLVESRMKALEAYANTCSLNRVELHGGAVGVIAASVAYQYAREVFPEGTSFLKLGMTYPLPMELIRDFAARVDKLYVIEELEPFMEMEIKAAGIDCEGKALTGKLYELNPELLRERIFGVKPDTRAVPAKAASRPPALCPGCPHRGFFYTLSKNKNFVVAGDIGCYPLGAAAPLSCMDVCVCMGGGFSAGMGMAKAFEVEGVTEKKVFGVVGDSTFFHSGMTGAAEIIYNRGRMIPCILDNRITGMTGHQENPGSGYTLRGEAADAIQMEKILEACGFRNIIIVDPLDLTAMQKAVDDALSSDVPAAIIARRPCLLLKRDRREKALCKVNAGKCRDCKKCLKVGCSAVSIQGGRAAIDPTQCVGCTVCAQVCSFDAITKEEA
jgi:indolepyruvate ferredoxin oxidoreductase alpha subunit